MSAKRTTNRAATKKPAAKKTAKDKKQMPEGKMSALDAAAKVLTESREAMTTKQMIEAMAAMGYWTSPGGATPDRFVCRFAQGDKYEGQERAVREDGTGRRQRQESLFIMTDGLPKSASHPFYKKLNELLAEAEFDRWIERRCQQYYATEEHRGQPSIPPGVYFRMLLVGYFEGIDSQRGIAWRCADSLSLRQFLGIPLDEKTPDPKTLSNTRRRLPEEVFDEMFQFVLSIAADKKLLSGKTVGVDSTLLEANAAMKSIVRRDTGEDWKQFVTRLMREEGAIEGDETPTDEEIRRFDKQRKGKKVSNGEWVSKSDPAARITQMKDGRTHLAYKAEHVVDLESDLILAAEIYPADHADTQTMVDSVVEAQINLQQAEVATQIEEVAADKGYHAAETIELSDDLNVRTYIPERKKRHRSRWVGKPPELRRAVYANRRRMQRAKGRKLQRLRSERCERTFAHVCDTGGMRRSWLKQVVNVSKRYLIAAAAHNLGRILRKLFGIGKPRVLQDFPNLFALAQILITPLIAYWIVRSAHWIRHAHFTRQSPAPFAT